MNSARLSFFSAIILTISVMLGSHVYAGTGQEQQDKQAELDRMREERRIENWKARIRAAAARSGKNLNGYRYAVSDQGEVYIYSNQGACALIRGYTQMPGEMPKETPALDSLYCP